MQRKKNCGREARSAGASQCFFSPNFNPGGGGGGALRIQGGTTDSSAIIFITINSSAIDSSLILDKLHACVWG